MNAAPIEAYPVDDILHEMFDNVLLQAMFLDQVLAIIDNGVLILDREQKVTVANEAVTEILGYSSEELVGKSVGEIFARLCACDDPDFIDGLLSAKKKTELTVTSKAGETLHLALGARRLKNERDEFAGHVVSIINLTEEKNLHLALAEKNKTLAKIANRDALTGLFNRLYMEDFLAQRILEARRYGTPLSMAMIDIDHFKRFNDMHGHLAGDAVLKEVARLISENSRAVDTATRYGGEEFSLILANTAIEHAAVVAERVRSAIERAVVRYADQELHVTISVGVAAFHPGRHADQDAFIGAADAALYEAKRAGRNRVVVSST